MSFGKYNKDRRASKTIVLEIMRDTYREEPFISLDEIEKRLRRIYQIYVGASTLRRYRAILIKEREAKKSKIVHPKILESPKGIRCPFCHRFLQHSKSLNALTGCAGGNHRAIHYDRNDSTWSYADTGELCFPKYKTSLIGYV